MADVSATTPAVTAQSTAVATPPAIEAKKPEATPAAPQEGGSVASATPTAEQAKKLDVVG